MIEHELALSVILPAFNEEALLGGCALALRKSLDSLGAAAEIIIVDDGSSDGTAAVADRLAATQSGIAAIHQQNQGIGGAFLTGVLRARGEYVILWPADMLAEPSDLMPYVNALGRADVIVGVRRARVGYNTLMRLNAWVYPRLVRLLFDFWLPDVNWIQAYRREKLSNIKPTQRGIPMLTEILVRLRDGGATFLSVEVSMRRRLSGTPSAAKVGVMWRTMKGLLAFWVEWRRDRRSGLATE